MESPHGLIADASLDSQSRRPEPRAIRESCGRALGTAVLVATILLSAYAYSQNMARGGTADPASAENGGRQAQSDKRENWTPEKGQLADVTPWLVKAINQNGGCFKSIDYTPFLTHTYSSNFTVSSLEPCIFQVKTIRGTDWEHQGSHGEYLIEYQVRLGELLLPVTVKRNGTSQSCTRGNYEVSAKAPRGLQMHIHDSGKEIFNFKTDDENEEKAHSAWIIPVSDARYADRIARALTEAITMCKGK